LNPSRFFYEAIKLTIVPAPQRPFNKIDLALIKIPKMFLSSSFSKFLLKIIGHSKDGGLIYHEFLLYENKLLHFDFAIAIAIPFRSLIASQSSLS